MLPNPPFADDLVSFAEESLIKTLVERFQSKFSFTIFQVVQSE